jgi:hypothetical protein
VIFARWNGCRISADIQSIVRQHVVKGESFEKLITKQEIKLKSNDSSESYSLREVKRVGSHQLNFDYQ